VSSPVPVDAPLDRLVAIGVPRRYPPGAMLFAEGDPAGPVFVVVEGEVSLFVGDATEPFSSVRAGELIGELSAIDHLPRTASAVAATEVDVRAVPAARFAELLHEEPQLALHIARAIAGKLRRATESRSAVVRGLPAPALATAILRRAVDGEHAGAVPALVDELETSHEMVSRAIDFLVASGAIALERGHVFVLDAGRLAEVATRDRP
jgi:CRP/FNR family transcriptional regulator